MTFKGSHHGCALCRDFTDQSSSLSLNVQMNSVLQENQPLVGSCFLSFHAQFSAYLTYCTNYKNAVELLIKTKAANPALDKWLAERQQVCVWCH